MMLVLALLLLLPSLAVAQDMPNLQLGGFTFDRRLFGDTMTPSVPNPPIAGAGAWINVVPVAPEPGTYLTGPNFNTGIALGLGTGFTITYNTPIINRPGPDLGIVTAPHPNPGEPNFNFFGITGHGFGRFDPLTAGVNTGVQRDYFFQEPGGAAGPGPLTLYVTPIDLSDLGVAEGEGITSVGINGSNGGAIGGPVLPTFRVAGFAQGDTVAVPEHWMDMGAIVFGVTQVSLLGLGLWSQSGRARARKERSR